MRFVLLLGFSMIAARLAGFSSDVPDGLFVILVIALLFDLVDFIMNIIKTFRR